MSDNTSLVPAEQLERRIVQVRGQNVMLDSDLAELYQVETKVLNQAVRRNSDRFPEDFMFRLTRKEFAYLRSQFVTSNDLGFQIGITNQRGGRRYYPYAFTQEGVAMLSSVLRSPRAILVNIEIMRAFIRLRRFLVTHHELAKKLSDLEQKYDEKFAVVFDAIRQLMNPPDSSQRRIGLRSEVTVQPAIGDDPMDHK